MYHLHKLSPGSKGKTVRCSRTAILVSCSLTYFMNTFQDSSGSIFSAILTCCSTALVNTHAKSLFKHYLERSSFFFTFMYNTWWQNFLYNLECTIHVLDGYVLISHSPFILVFFSLSFFITNSNLKNSSISLASGVYSCQCLLSPFRIINRSIYCFSFLKLKLWEEFLGFLFSQSVFRSRLYAYKIPCPHWWR